MKWLFLLIIGALISTGCGQRDPAPTTAPSSVATAAESVATVPTATEQPIEAQVEPTIEPEPPVQEESVDPTSAVPTELPPPATTEIDSTVPQESSTEEAVVSNGLYENSYFRGAPDAPVTIIDYSDFL